MLCVHLLHQLHRTIPPPRSPVQHHAEKRGIGHAGQPYAHGLEALLEHKHTLQVTRARKA